MSTPRAKLDLGDGTLVEHGQLFNFEEYVGLQRAVMPVVVVRGGEMSGIGTAVCIGPGWFLTAAHVVEGLDTEDSDVRVILETDTQLGSGSDDVYGGAFSIRAIHSHPEVDLATLTVELPASAFDEIRTLDLRLRLPGPGEPVAIVGYPHMARDQTISGGGRQSVSWERTLAVGAGVVLDHQLERLLRPIRGFPGFETDAPAPPGTSGGPVLDASNSVIGFVSSSNGPSADHQGWNSFVGLLGPALELSVVDLASDLTRDPLLAPSVRLVELVMSGAVDVEAHDSFDVDASTGKVRYLPPPT